MSLDRWPIENFPVAGFHPWLAETLLSGGPSIAGPGQVKGVSGGGWWCFDLDGSVLTDPTDIAGWRAMILLCDGGAQAIEVPFVDGVIPGSSGVPHSDGSAFGDGSQYTSGVGITATLHADAALRATQVVLNLTLGGPFQGGEVFTLVGPTYGARLHMVRRQISLSGSNYTLDVRPPLREALTAGTVADFAQPRCTMRLLPDGKGGEWPNVQAPWEAVTSVRFAETF